MTMVVEVIKIAEVETAMAPLVGAVGKRPMVEAVGKKPMLEAVGKRPMVEAA
jgi:hypothetical protein